MAAAFLCIPTLFRILGTDRFGILTLALAFIGYFGLLDFGLGRALTQAISEKIGQNRSDEAPGLIWTGFTLLTMLSAVAVAACLLMAPTIIHLLKIPVGVEDDAIVAFYVLSLSIPLVIGSAALWGVLAAYQRFDLSNRIGIPLGVATYAGPVIALHWFDSLVAVMAVLLLVRTGATVGLAVMCLRVVPGLAQGHRFVRQEVRRLVSFGGWLTLSSVIAPLMTSADRFIIGALISVTAVGYYGTTYDIVTKLWVIPVGLLTVVGPALTVSLSSNSANTARLFERAAKYLFFILFAAALFLVVFAHEGFQLWLGRDFADHAARVLQWLAAGVFLNSLSQLPAVALASHGRPDIAAKLQSIEILLYLPVLYGAIHYGGIVGAAAGSALRMIVEAAVLFLIVARYMPAVRSVIRRLLAAVPLALAVLLIGSLLNGLIWKATFFAVALILLGGIAWRVALSPAERSYVSEQLRFYRTRMQRQKTDP